MQHISKKLVLMSALMLATAGCTVKPVPLTDTEIATQISSDLKEMTKDYEPITAPLTLHQAIQRTLAHNLEYRLKLMEDALALRQVDIASYEMLPRLTAQAGYTQRDSYNASSSMSYLTNQQSLEPSYSQEKGHFTADLGLTWNILDFGVSYFQAKQQADRALIMNERRRKVVHTVVQQVRHTYWLALGAQQLQGSFEPLLLEVKQALDDTDQIEKQKLRPPLETLNYRKTLLETLRQMEAFRDELNQAKPRLATLMNLPPGQDFKLDTNEPMLIPAFAESVTNLEAMALRLRPELMEARLQERISLQETKKAIAKMLPGIDLSVGPHLDTNTFLANKTWIEGGARATWNLMSLITGPAQYKLAKNQEEVSRMSRLALSMAVLTQVHVAYQDFFSKKRQYELAQQIQELDAKIFNQTQNAVVTGAKNKLDEIKTSITSLMADYRKYQNYAALQNAYGQLLVTVGSVPLIGNPAEVLQTKTDKKVKQ